MSEDAIAAQIQAVREAFSEALQSRERLPNDFRIAFDGLTDADWAGDVWRIFGTDAEGVREVVDLVRNAVDNAFKENHRPIGKEEKADIQRVIALAKELRKAISQSSLPPNTTYLDELVLVDSSGDRVTVSLGWHSIEHDPFGTYPLAIVDVLDKTAELAERHLQKLPVRSVARRKEQPLITAFVRNLAWLFGRHYGEEKRTAIAHITNAVFMRMKFKAGGDVLSSPLDRTAVDNILKDRPPQYVPLPKR